MSLKENHLHQLDFIGSLASSKNFQIVLSCQIDDCDYEILRNIRVEKSGEFE